MGALATELTRLTAGFWQKAMGWTIMAAGRADVGMRTRRGLNRFNVGLMVNGGRPKVECPCRMEAA